MRARKQFALLLLACAGPGCAVLPAHAAKKDKKKADTTAHGGGPAQVSLRPHETRLAQPAQHRARALAGLFCRHEDRLHPASHHQAEGNLDGPACRQPVGGRKRSIPRHFPSRLIGPYGIAIDSKGLVYVADQSVGAVFIFNTETHDTQLIRNGYEAHFGWINGLAIDDDDRLFVSDGKMHRVLIFNPKHEVESQITEGLVDPVGLAIDTENRFLYVVDTQQDQVIVYDADTLKLLRRIGTGGKNHFLTTPGDFGAPQGVALDKDGNVYVTDTLNDRVEIFDADGNFISTFGKNGDGPGYFARPKGIAIDGDGHIWVADEMQDRLQVFNSRRPVADLYRHGTRRPSRPVQSAGRSRHRQAEPCLHHRTVSGPLAGFPIRERRGSGRRKGAPGKGGGGET